MPSRNSFSVSSKCYRFIGIAIKQIDAPFSQARSSERFTLKAIFELKYVQAAPSLIGNEKIFLFFDYENSA